MKKRYVGKFGAMLAVFSCVAAAIGQSGGSYQINQSVIAGGGSWFAGDMYTLEGTIGQSLAGTTSAGGAYSLTSGFWGGEATPVSNVSISGRVTTPSGAGLRNAVVTLTDAQGTQRSVVTSAFGFYTFAGVQTGQTYVVRVLSKRFRFQPLSLPVSGELTGVDFIGFE